MITSSTVNPTTTNRSATTTTVTAAMAGSVDDLGAAPPDSWEVADLDVTMSRLMLSSKRDNNNNSNSDSRDVNTATTDSLAPVRSSSGSVLDNLVDSVDQFLREALQNPRERLSGLFVCFFKVYGFMWFN